MEMLGQLLRNFFTHKDFLPPADQWPGTLFTPMQIIFCSLVAVGIGFACVRYARKTEQERKRVFVLLWILMVVSEPAIAAWDCWGGAAYRVDWTSVLSLWPCSIFLYAAPFAFFGKGHWKTAACGYICTLGLLGGGINFVYPATYLSRYSCLSMAGLRTIFYHGSMLFVGITMLLAGDHSYKSASKWWHLLLPSVPALLVSIPANIVNFTVPGADYMFFKLESFFVAPIGRALPDWLTVGIVYVLYVVVEAAPYVPGYLASRRQAKTGTGVSQT